MLEPYRQLGYPIFGPSKAAAELELDREAGQKVMKESGLNVIPSKSFHDFKDAARFVEKTQNWTVCKPSGDANKALSFVGCNAAALIYMLTVRWPKNEKYVADAKSHGFLLQEKKEGCEMAVGGWFGPAGWSEPWCHNWEYKKFMAGDKGPTTGEQGTLATYVKKSKLADIALKPITKSLRALDYVGYCDVNGAIDEAGEYWPFEFTMRPGWPIFHNQMALTEGDPAQWMLDLCNGKDTLKVKYDTPSISVVVSIPDYPHSKLTRREVDGIPVYNCGDREHIHLSGVRVEDAPVQAGDKVITMPAYVTADDYVFIGVGTGETITGARRSAYSAIKKVKIATNDEQLRYDIGRGRLVDQLEGIQKLGFARELQF
jgi:phosphoribosylamine--glycine ligase